MTNQTTAAAKRNGAGRRLLTAPLRLSPSSIWRREFRAAMPAMGALAFLSALIGLTPTIQRLMSHGTLHIEAEAFLYGFVAGAYMAALVLGVLCGAEEIESGTADVPRRLPVPAGRILLEKLVGSCAAFLFWAALFAALALLSALVLGRNPVEFASYLLSEKFLIQDRGAARLAFVWQIIPALYLLGLAAGVWTGRVLVSAVIAGALLLVYTALAIQIGHGLGHTPRWSVPTYWPLMALAAPLAVIGFFAREGAGLRGAFGVFDAGFLAPTAAPYDLAWKEWRAKRALLLCFVILIALVAATAVLTVPWDGFPFFQGKASPAAVLLGGLLALGVVVLAATLFTAEEGDPARSFLYTLPISRGTIIGEKIRALILQTLVLGLGVLAAGSYLIPLGAARWRPPSARGFEGGTAVSLALLCGLIGLLILAFAARWRHRVLDFGVKGVLLLVVGWLALHGLALASLSRDFFTLTWLALACLPLMALAAVIGLHVRSVVVAVVLAAILGAPMVAILCGDLAFMGQAWIDRDGRMAMALRVLLNCLTATVLLFGWLHFLFRRTPILELKPTPRLLLGVLFGILTIELFFTIYLCDWRDLAFILFGV